MIYHTLIGILCVNIFAILGSCQSGKYQAPAPIADEERRFELSLDRPSGEVWFDLLDYLTDTYFGIEEFDRDSGLILLDFGAMRPADFVDGGKYEIKSSSGTKVFSGNYVDYLWLANNGKLSGRMNVLLRPSAEGGSNLKVSARYVFSSVGIDPLTSLPYNNSWVFETGSSATINVRNPVRGTEASRTLRPTHRAERDILEAILHLSDNGL